MVVVVAAEAGGAHAPRVVSFDDVLFSGCSSECRRIS